MTLGIIGVTKYGAVSAIDSRRGVNINSPQIAPTGKLYATVKKDFELPGNRIMIHSGQLRYQFIVKPSPDGTASVNVSDDPLVRAVRNFQGSASENLDDLLGRLSKHLNENLRDSLPDASPETINKMQMALLAQIRGLYKNATGKEINFISDFNGLVQHASVIDVTSGKEIDRFTATIDIIKSLVGGYKGNTFELYKIETPSLQKPTKLLQSNPFGFACVGEMGLAEKELSKLNWGKLTLEGAIDAVVNAIMQTAAQCEVVGGPINCTVLEPGKQIVQFQRDNIIQKPIVDPWTQASDDLFSSFGSNGFNF